MNVRSMSPWEKLLQQPQDRAHFLQLYRSPSDSLIRNVSAYLHEGARRGDGLLVVATPDHRDALRQDLLKRGTDLQALLSSRQLVIFDARMMLGRILAAGQPDWGRFEAALGEVLRTVARGAPGASLRVYGEMVAVLWNARQFRAAIRLEQFWNRLLEQWSFSLYCSYPIDVFGNEGHAGCLDEILQLHSHLLPDRADVNEDSLLDLAAREIIGDHYRAIEAVRDRHTFGAVAPSAEKTVLLLRKHFPHRVEEVIQRSRRGRQQPGLNPDAS
jgi:hypothetical protein